MVNAGVHYFWHVFSIIEERFALTRGGSRIFRRGGGGGGGANGNAWRMAVAAGRVPLKLAFTMCA